MKITTKCGGTVIVPRGTQDHLKAHPEMEEILAEVIGKVQLPEDGGFLATEVEMGRIVGLSGCVETQPVEIDEPACFAQRIGRDKPSRVMVGKGEETTKVAVLAFPAKEEVRTYVLITAFAGTLAPKEPWDPNIKNEEEYQEALAFWSSNALIYDPKVMGPIFESTWEKILKKGGEKKVDVRAIETWSRVSGQAVEFVVEGKTFQITGKKGMSGVWERFFHADSYPTRRKVGEEEANVVLAKADKFLIYQLRHDDGETVPKEKLFKEIEKLFK